MVDIAAVPVPEDQVTGLRLADWHARSLGVLRLRPVGQIDALRPVGHGDQTGAVIARSFARPHVGCTELGLCPRDCARRGIRVSAATGVRGLTVARRCRSGSNIRALLALRLCLASSLGSSGLTCRFRGGSLARSFSGRRLTLSLEVGLALVDQFNRRILLARQLLDQRIAARRGHGLRACSCTCRALRLGGASLYLCGCGSLLGLRLDGRVIHDIGDLLQSCDLLHFDVCRGREGVERCLFRFNRAQSVGGEVRCKRVERRAAFTVGRLGDGSDFFLPCLVVGLCLVCIGLCLACGLCGLVECVARTVEFFRSTLRFLKRELGFGLHACQFYFNLSDRHFCCVFSFTSSCNVIFTGSCKSNAGSCCSERSK